MRNRRSVAMSAHQVVLFAVCLLFSDRLSAEAATAAQAGQASVPQAGQASVVTPARETPRDSSDPAARTFVETCSGCHAIGGGVSRGPDLATVAAWPEAQLASAIRTMEKKVGPIQPAQLDGLVQLLKDAAVRERIGKARAQLAQLNEKAADPANSLLGGALFFGQVSLENGGMPCASCHRYRGEGGELAPDLSHFAGDTAIDVLGGSIQRAGFKVMRAAYAAHPISQQEGRHIAAFMKQAKADRIVGAFADTTSLGLGIGIGAFALVLTYIFSRPRGVRVRLIQRAKKR